MDLNAFHESHHVCSFSHNTADHKGSQIATEGKACDWTLSQVPQGWHGNERLRGFSLSDSSLHHGGPRFWSHGALLFPHGPRPLASD